MKIRHWALIGAAAGTFGLVILTLGVWFIIGTQESQVLAHDSQAIRSVIQQEQAFDMELKATPHGRGSMPKQIAAIAKFADQVQRIDLTQCPRDFQLAYLGYGEAVKEISIENNRSDELILAAVLEAVSHSNAPSKILDENHAAIIRLQRAQMNVKSVELKYYH